MDDSKKLLSDITVYSKYARYLPEQKRRETWDEIITRNMSMHIKKYPELAEEIGKAYQLVFDKKVLPSMRSLQFAGRAIELNNTRLFNCSYLPIDDYFAFAEVMFLLMSGTGVGYSVQENHVKKLPTVKKPIKRKRRFLIPDTIEGWADAIKVLMKAYFFNLSTPVFDYSLIRPKGSILKTSGGKAPGPQPLKDAIHNIRSVLDAKETNSQLTSLEVHDILCHLADAVLSGGIRRSAMISLFDIDDTDMLECKFGMWYEDNPQRARANNSATIVRHKASKKVFDEIWNKVRLSKSGEPGIFFTNDAMRYGTNPCGEISLRENQFCNLTEVNVSDVQTQEDLDERSRVAAFIGTLQAGYTDFHYLRDSWKETTEKDALIGVGMTGIASGKVLGLDMQQAAEIAREENKRVAKLMGIKPAARVLTIKPSGTSSIVLGCSSGIHAWHAPYYVRRMRFNKLEPISRFLQQKIPEFVEDDVFNSNNIVLSIPVKAPEGSIYRDESALQFLERVKKVYTEWVKVGHRKGDNTNNVSATVSVGEDEWDEVGEWMWKNKNFYNGLSVLPRDNGTYVQAPFEDISKEKYENMIKKLKQLDLSEIIEEEDNTELKENLACTGGSCEIN